VKTQAQVVAEHAAAAAKKLLHRKFHWCRLENGFLDMPLWRTIAAKTGLHLTIVQAFVTRLDCFANAQKPRGDLTYFDPAEFGMALDIPAEQAALLFAALEDGPVPWIDQDHIATFWARNPDSDRDAKPVSDAERTARSRKFRAALRELARQKACGLIDAAELLRKHLALDELRAQGRRGAVTWEEQRAALAELTKFSTAGGRHDGIVTGAASAVARHPGASAGQQTKKADVTPDRDTLAARPTRHEANVTGAVDETAQGSDQQQKNLHRDIRDCHARSDQKFKLAPVDNSGGGASGESAGLSNDARAAAGELYLRSEGRRRLIELMAEHPGRVDTLIERWAAQLGGDYGALRDVVRNVVTRFEAAGATVPGALSVWSLIEQGIKAHLARLAAIAAGPTLPLMSALQGGATDNPQAVTTHRDGRDAVETGEESPRDDRKKAVGDGLT
jgi:hypothetical protein